MNFNALASFLPDAIPPVIRYLILIVTVVLALYGIAVLVRNSRNAKTEETPSAPPVGSPDDAAVAAAIAASLAVMEDEATVAAITAAVACYLEEENRGRSSLPTGFRVVSFRKRGGAWNRITR